LKTWKADCVLNDGAPNVGKAWVHDAFSQAQLALSALKLACEFLKKGGWFITKVFRSKDYANLLLTFQALFEKVHATKPQASRNESAEIFVVCQGFLAPTKLDPKLLDMKHVFKENEEQRKQRIDIFRPEKNKRQRDGYEEGNYTLFKAIGASEFVSCDNPVEMLSTNSKIMINDDKYANNPLTTQEIKICCEDLKILGKKELKNILAWRRKLRKEEQDATGNKKLSSVGNEKETAEESEESLEKVIEDLKEEELKEARRKAKHMREKKMQYIKLGEKTTGLHDDSVEMDLFSLKAIESKEHLGKISQQDEGEENKLLHYEDDSDSLAFKPDSDSLENESDDDSDEHNDLYDDALYGAKRPRMENESPQLTNEQKKIVANLKMESKKKMSSNPLVVSLKDEVEDATTTQSKNWFQKEIFKQIEDDEEDYDVEVLMSGHRRKGTSIIGDSESGETADESALSCKEQVHKDLDDGNSSVDDDKENGESGDSDSDIDDRSISLGRETKGTPGYLTPEALALGAAMATSRKRKRDLIDDAYNRYSYGKEDLPTWFADEEKKYSQIQFPITKDEVYFYKERLKAINARPMKKLMEAQARKKNKLLKKMEKVRKRADNVLENEDVSEKEKMYQVKSMYKKAGLLHKKKIEKKYVVAKKGLAGKKYPRPSGVKGLYKVVDARMKKDLRAMKNKEKTKNRASRRKAKSRRH